VAARANVNVRRAKSSTPNSIVMNTLSRVSAKTVWLTRSRTARGVGAWGFRRAERFAP